MRTRTFLILVAALVLAFAAFLFANERLAEQKAWLATKRYAQFLAPQLWNIDQVYGQEYAALISDFGGYRRLEVLHEDGTPFVTISSADELPPFERFLINIGLVQEVPFSLPIRYQDQRIGRMNVVWMNRSGYLYLYALILLLLLLVVLVLVKLGRAAAYQRRRAEEELSESRERLRTVVAGAPIILFAVNREGIFTLSEGKGLAKIGRHHGELVGFSIYDAYEDAAAVTHDLERAFRGETFTVVRKMRGKTFETWYSPLNTSDGKVERVIGVSTDVTELQRAVEQLESREESMRQELSLARKIQRAMLPDHLPKVPDLQIGLVFVPSGDIGGDFVDFIEFGSRSRELGIVFADITGHGVPAALLSAMFKVVIDDVLRDCESLESGFEILNSRLAREFPRGNFASAFYCLVDAGRRRLRYVKASQEPALLFRQGEAPRKLEAGGPVLGVLDPEQFPYVQYHQHEEQLKPGDTLFLYTDGLLEIENAAGEMLDRGMLMHWIEELIDLHPQQLVEKLHARAINFAGRAELPDDLAALAVRLQK